MTTMISEVYDALVDAGASEEKARKAAEAIATYDANLAAINARLGSVDGRLSGIESRVTMLTWAVGLNAAATLGVLAKLVHG